MINQISYHKQIDWNSWGVKNVEKCLNLFIELKWCKKKSDLKKQYLHLLRIFKKIERDKEKILNLIIDKSFELKLFMALHSRFDDNVSENSDWLEKYMFKKLSLNDNELYKLLHPKPVPQHLLDLLKDFEPEQVVFEQDPIEITYGMWEKDSDNRLIDPIHITYLNWQDQKPKDVKSILSRYESIECDPGYENTFIIEDDLPF